MVLPQPAHTPSDTLPHTPPRMAAGKRQLMDAALRLLARQQDTDTLSLRELAREAGLNHNTFYRHFQNLQDLQSALMDDFTSRLREGTRQARANVASHPSVVHRVVGWLFDFADLHRDVFLVAYRTLHGPPSEARQQLQNCLDELRRDMLQEQRAMQLLPPGHDEVWLRVLAVYGRAVYGFVVRYLENPRQRAALLRESEELLAVLVAGTIALHPPAATSSTGKGRQRRAP